MKIIDAHVHCGNSQLEGAKFYPKDEMLRELKEVNASGAVVMAFPEDIYRMANTPAQRNEANEYILKIARNEKDVHPFYFVWTDYIIPDNLDEYSGIKWHRHEGEPTYDYNSSACKDFLNEIKKLAIPVLLEEEFINTVKFIENNPKLTVIIPHIGESNGGSEKMEIFFDNPNVLFDTAITDKDILQWAYDSVGPERLIFGTDSSACRPVVDNSLPVALKRHRELDTSNEDLELIFSKNIERILQVCNRKSNGRI